VLLLYFAAILFAICYFHARDNVAGFLAALAVASVVFIAIVAWKGEKPLKWRWDGK
jgi:hypothetical protein